MRLTYVLICFLGVIFFSEAHAASPESKPENPSQTPSTDAILKDRFQQRPCPNCKPHEALIIKDKEILKKLRLQHKEQKKASLLGPYPKIEFLSKKQKEEDESLKEQRIEVYSNSLDKWMREDNLDLVKDSVPRPETDGQKKTRTVDGR